MHFLQALLSLVLTLAVAAPARSTAADRLILRNLDIIYDRTVTAVDDDGIVLDSALPNGRTRLTWDEIERGRVALDQPRFDSLLGELGLPLYRVRQRLKLGDVSGAGEIAEGLYSRFRERRGQSAYLVGQAVVWSRLAAGRVESAVEPSLRCYELLRTKAATLSELPGARRPKFDVETGLSNEIPPLFFDAAAAKSALGDLERVNRWMTQPRPAGAYVFYAALAATAGDSGEVERVIPLLTGSNGSSAFVALVGAEQEFAARSVGPAVENLKANRETLPEACQSAVSFLVGASELKSDDADRCRDGLLELFSIPAAHGREQRELAAAALYYAAEGLDKLKDATGAAAVRGELSARFGNTRFGKQGRDKQ